VLIGLRLMHAAPMAGVHRVARAAEMAHLMGRRSATPSRDTAPGGAATGRRAACSDVDDVRAIGIPHHRVGERVGALGVPVQSRHPAIEANATSR
jgi:hypothetical protein